VEERSVVSILDRLTEGRHLDDRGLAEIWSAATADGRTVAHPHLATCAQCRARFAAFDSWLDGLRDEAHAEADDVFPPDRLAAQQAQIARRLDALERPARVIAFPRFGRPITSTQGSAQRWITAAAAAAFVVGLAAGQLLDLRQAFDRSDRRTAADSLVAPATSSRGGVTPVGYVMPSDEALLFGDTDVSGRRVTALQSLDEITLGARDLDLPR
jgi:anti-sigma factor RsiW